MAMFSNDVRVVNTATPAFHTDPNVTQYGWTKSDAAYYNQLIQYVDEARQIYEYISEKVIYFDGVLSKLANIEDVIDFMVQKGNEVAEDARDVRAATSYVAGAKTQIESMYNHFNADYIIFNSKYADFSVKYQDVLEKAYAAQLSAEAAEKAYQATKDLYEDLKDGQVYRGVWNPEVTPTYPDGGGTNSTWDVVLNFGTTTVDAEGKTWRSGDRLIYALVKDEYFQINTGAGVDSINGLTGSVTLAAADVGAVPTTGGTMTGALYFGDNNKYVSLNVTDIFMATKQGKVVLEGVDDPVARVKGFDYKIYHKGNRPTAEEVGAIGKTNHQFMTDSLTASQFKASGQYAFISSIRDRHGMYLDGAGINHRTIIGGGGETTGDQTGSIYLRPNSITDARGQTIFTAFGQISNPTTPIDNSHLTNKLYVDGKTLAEPKPATGEGLLMRVGGTRDEEIKSALAGATGGAYMSETPPPNPFPGARWFDTNEGRTFLWYIDDDSSQWVEENPQSADIVSGSPRLIKLADQGILDLGLNIKNALTVKNGSSISYQDGGHSVFHNFAEGNGLEWAHGNLGENTVMTLNAAGLLQTTGPMYANSGFVCQSHDMKTWVSIETGDGINPYIATRSLNEPNTRKTIDFQPDHIRCAKPILANKVEITDDAGLRFAPSTDYAGITYGVGIDSTRKFGIHRYVDRVWTQTPMEVSSDGSVFFNANVYGNGSINANGGYLSATRDNNPMLELHSPGRTAGAIYLPGPGRMRFAQSNGAGGEAALYAEFQSQAAHFVGSVRPDVRSSSWGQWGDAVGGVQDNAGSRLITPGQWFPMVTSASYTDPSQGYAGRWSLGYYRPAANHNGEVVLNMNGDGTLRNNLRFVYSGSAGGRFGMDGSEVGQTWALQEGGFLYGSSFGTYANMVNWCTGSFAPISDEKLKNNIQSSTESALDNVSKIKFHSYDWVDGKTKSTKIGMVAQELESIDPSYAHDIETYNPDGSVNTSVKALDTANLLSLALKSIQELKAEIEELKEKVNG